MTDKDHAFYDVAKLLKISFYIGAFNVLGSAVYFFGILILAGEKAVGKGTYAFGVLAVLMVMYAIPSWRASAIISAGHIPKIDYLTFLTVFNLVILGLPLSFLGCFALLVGFRTIDFGSIDSDLLIAIVLFLCGFQAVLFFTSHIITLVCVKKIRRLKSDLVSKDSAV
jgi:hypothetical protein